MRAILRLLRLPFDLLSVLRDIDSRLERLESCVATDEKTRRQYVRTGSLTED